MHQTERKIEPRAREIVDGYLALPVGAKPRCPYFNNRRKKVRGGLRVQKGKGSPEEIAEECKIEAVYAKEDISLLSTDKLKAFLVDRDLGVDCSGFAYHVLSAALAERKGKSLAGAMKTRRTGPFGSLVARLRPAENIGVATFADDRNSFEIKASEAEPGDIIVFMGTGPQKTYNHILVITGVAQTDGATRLSYANSYAWPSDGLYGHGVREGEILVHGDDLLGGTWKEQGQTGDANYTFASAREAKAVSVRRLRCMA